MIRVYFDWNVISNLKRSEFKELNDFIAEHKERLLFPYSPAHFKDLMKSYSPDNIHFNTDLEKLDYLSGKHLIRWGQENIEPLFGTPQEYFEVEKENEQTPIFENYDFEKLFSDLDESTKDLGLGNIGQLMKTLLQSQPTGIEITTENKEMLSKLFPNLTANSNMWDFMKDLGPFMNNLLNNGEYYKDFRKSIGDSGFKLEANAGNWDVKEVIKNIDKFLSSKNTNLSFLDYVETTLKSQKESYTYYDFYTTSYLMLDMMGYKADGLPKSTDNMQNIQTDGEHSFYGGHCDYFVAIDKKLRTKSKVLYNEFNLPVPILTPEEFLSQIKQVIHTKTNIEDFLNEAIGFFKEEYITETHPPSKENKITTVISKLPVFYFDFFNYGVHQHYEELQYVMITFKRSFQNYSRFIYYTEAERLVEEVCNFFGSYTKEDIEVKKKEIADKDSSIELVWQFNEVSIKLLKDEETGRPILIYLVKIKD